MVDKGRPFITELASGEHRSGVGSGRITTHHVVFYDYRTVAGSVRGKAFFAPSASRGETRARTGTVGLSPSLLPTMVTLPG